MNMNYEHFVAALDAIESERETLRRLGDSCVVPVCGGVALVRGELTKKFTIKLSDDLFIRVQNRESALAVLDRIRDRLDFAWLAELERLNDKDGIEEFERRYKIAVEAEPQVAQQRREDQPEPLFFESHEDLVAHEKLLRSLKPN